EKAAAYCRPGRAASSRVWWGVIERQHRAEALIPPHSPPPASPQPPPSLGQPAGWRASPAPTSVLTPPHPPWAVLALACRGLACAPTGKKVAAPLSLFFSPPSIGGAGRLKKARLF